MSVLQSDCEKLVVCAAGHGATQSTCSEGGELAQVSSWYTPFVAGAVVGGEAPVPRSQQDGVERCGGCGRVEGHLRSVRTALVR